MAPKDDFDLTAAERERIRTIEMFLDSEPERRGLGGRVTVGHVTKLAMRPAHEVAAIGRRPGRSFAL